VAAVFKTVPSFFIDLLILETEQNLIIINLYSYKPRDVSDFANVNEKDFLLNEIYDGLLSTFTERKNWYF
jgi:hypothetical protein